MKLFIIFEKLHFKKMVNQFIERIGIKYNAKGYISFRITVGLWGFRSEISFIVKNKTKMDYFNFFCVNFFCNT